MPFKKNKVLLIASATLWFFSVGAGMAILSNYTNTPGAVRAPSPEHWPADSNIQRDANRATLVMMVHPHCPCTRASVSELARLMAQTKERVTAYVLFNKPPNISENWEQTDLWHTAAAIPGVAVMRDDEGVEARRFNSATSGQTILYDKDGKLVFSGGITGGRGHEGDNAGRSAIVSLLTTNDADQTETAVFGCSLFAQTECQSVKEAVHPKLSN